VVDPKPTLASNRFGERGDGVLAQVFDRPAGGADQVVVMARLAPDVGGNVARPLESLRQPSRDQGVERPKHGSPADVGMLLADPLVQFLG
jgi:hypothetical protein